MSFATLSESTKHQGLGEGVRGCGAGSQRNMECFLTALLKKKTVLSTFMSVFSVRNK